MGSKINVVTIAAGIFIAAVSGMVRADDTAMNPELPTAASSYAHDLQSSKSGAINSPAFLLAANEGDVLQGQAGVAPVAEFKPPLISGRKVHQYLGLSTVAFAGLTILAAPEDEEGSSQTQPRPTSGTTHTRLARTTAALAVATVMTGLIYHWDDFHLEDGYSDPDNQHALLAGTGALLLLYAVNKSANSSVPTSHAGIAELGAVSMLAAIKLTW
jgi:hypothetical protein